MDKIIEVEHKGIQFKAPTSLVVAVILERLGVNTHKSVAVATAVPSIGTYWEGQGGVYAGVMRGKNGVPDYHLVVAKEDLGEAEYGPRTEVSDADDQFDGAKNTAALLSFNGTHPAAKKCAELTVDEHNDFYLPARRELSLLYANVPELFAEVWHWSSTQYSAYSAWVQGFDGGGQHYYGKSGGCRVRAVRRVLI